MPRPSDARTRLIRVSAALFRQRGYDGVGLNEILAAASAPKGSFYHHFPEGKEQLGEAVIRHSGAEMGKAIDSAMEGARDLASGLRALVGGLADWFERSGFSEGCPVTSIALDTSLRIGSHAAAVREVFADWEAKLVGHARRLNESSFSASDAEHLIMLVEGAWILARVQQSKEPLHRAIEAFLVGWNG
ncbi:TetR/AcrR family transcriptional regulator [Terrarubrum flagellatum]|uniref:TetR/AcrR family transcriptional regulator n=1 Tax=Terrirubrum flagellatum TaxID=2895980 RepID=UPI0031456B67